MHYNSNCAWALASARHARHFVGFARSEVHAQHIRKTLVASVVAEIIEGTQDGFGVRRFLSAQRPLGGSTEEGGAKTEPTEADPAAGSGKGAKIEVAATETSKGEGSGNESPSSSSDESK